ncbi:MAG: CYTH domain-containing protein [Ignavibacteriales bacterium]|nr:CYTH domain-containing protein [Ignavibacteriales bacterium]
MGIEIERKYLVKSDEWKSSGVKKLYQQGYLLIDKTKTIRVRTIEDTAYLTIKGASSGISRSEFEYEIPVEDAKFMLANLCEKPIIEKYRTKIELNELIWEVDEFVGDNTGLIIAEVELKNEYQKIVLPDWIGEEVSGNPKYNNSYLVKNPYKNWND